MEQFNLLLPEGRNVTCLEDSGVLSAKKLKKVLQSYQKKVSGCKADIFLHDYALFCSIKEASSAYLAEEGSMRELPSHLWTYEALIKHFCYMLPCTSDF